MVVIYNSDESRVRNSLSKRDNYSPFYELKKKINIRDFEPNR